MLLHALTQIQLSYLRICIFHFSCVPLPLIYRQCLYVMYTCTVFCIYTTSKGICTYGYGIGHTVYEYMGHPKSIRILKNFCTSDNQFFVKFWLPPFSTMGILNLKVGTVPRKFEKSFWTTNRPRHFFLYRKIVISFRGAVVQIKNYLKTVKREKFFKNFA